jgi:uncharacterized protein
MPAKKPTSARARKTRRQLPKPPSLAKIRPTILRITEKHGAKHVRIFGSFARGEQHKRSDVDLIITLPNKASLLDLAGIKIDLEEELRRKVDLLTEDGISPYLREHILREAKPL